MRDSPCDMAPAGSMAAGAVKPSPAPEPRRRDEKSHPDLAFGYKDQPPKDGPREVGLPGEEEKEMIAWPWCVVAFFFGGYLGILVMALCNAAASADRKQNVPGRYVYPERRKR